MTGDVNQAHIKKLEQLPTGWIETTVSKVVSMISTNRKKLPQKKYMEEAEFPVIDQGQDYIGGYYNDAELLIEGEPPFIVFGDHSRTFKFANFNFIPGADGVKVMQPIGINPKWAFYIFQAIPLPNKGYARHFQYVKEAYLPVPPLEQQKRIVAKIEELFSHIDAGIAALNKTKKLLKQYRQSVLKAAVSGELTKQWREENKDKLKPASQLLERILIERREKWEAQQLAQFEAKGKIPKDEKWKGKYKEPLKYSYEGELPAIPESWIWASPEELASTDKHSLAIGPFGSNLKVSDYREEGVPLVFVRNIRRHKYNVEGGKFVTPAKAEALQAHSILGGDVLITKMGEPPGDASIYPKDAPGAIITADCIKWRFSHIIKKPSLYVHYINSWFIKAQVVGRTKGVAQKKISLGTFKTVAFPLAPLLEQNEILKKVERKMLTMDRLEKEVETQLIKSAKNKQSILAFAFTGRLINAE